MGEERDIDVRRDAGGGTVGGSVGRHAVVEEERAPLVADDEAEGADLRRASEESKFHSAARAATADNVSPRAGGGRVGGVITLTPVRRLVSTGPGPTWRSCSGSPLAVQRTVRDAAGSPHRADVVAMGAGGTPTEEIDRVAEREVLDAPRSGRGRLEPALARRSAPSTAAATAASSSTRSTGRRTRSVGSRSRPSRSPSGPAIWTVSMSRSSGTSTSGTTYWATRGGGAFRDGRPIRTTPGPCAREVVFLNLGHHTADRRAGSRARCGGCDRSVAPRSR